jgi:hypothetical protein
MKRPVSVAAQLPLYYTVSRICLSLETYIFSLIFETLCSTTKNINEIVMSFILFWFNSVDFNKGLETSNVSY